MSSIPVATESTTSLTQATPDGPSAGSAANGQLTDQELFAPSRARASSRTGSHRSIASVSFSSWR